MRNVAKAVVRARAATARKRSCRSGRGWRACDRRSSGRLAPASTIVMCAQREPGYRQLSAGRRAHGTADRAPLILSGYAELGP